MSNKRAVTDEQKKEIILRLYRLWIAGDNKFLRLGQLIQNVFEKSSFNPKTGEPVLSMDFYSIEDFDFIEELEKTYAKKLSH